MIGLTDLEVYNSIFNITEENNKFELYIDTFDEFSFTELNDGVAEILNNSDMTPYHLQHETIAPHIVETFQKLRLEKSSTDGYYILLMSYLASPFRDFESYLRIVVELDENDIQLILKQYNSKFVTYDIAPSIYTIKDISEAVHTMGDHERSIQFEYDDVSMKTKLIFKHFGTPTFDDKSFLNTLLGFTPYWDYKPTNASNTYSLGVYTSGKSFKFEYNK